MTHTREERRDLVDRILLLRLAEQNGLVPIVRDVVLLAFRRDVEFICLVKPLKFRPVAASRLQIVTSCSILVFRNNIRLVPECSRCVDGAFASQRKLARQAYQPASAALDS